MRFCPPVRSNVLRSCSQAQLLLHSPLCSSRSHHAITEWYTEAEGQRAARKPEGDTWDLGEELCSSVPRRDDKQVWTGKEGCRGSPFVPFSCFLLRGCDLFELSWWAGVPSIRFGVHEFVSNSTCFLYKQDEFSIKKNGVQLYTGTPRRQTSYNNKMVFNFIHNLSKWETELQKFHGLETVP